MSYTAEYRAWAHMKDRCNNEKDYNYKNYGGRGIGVCIKWESFEGFFKDMGKKPSSLHSIERIDNDKGYSLKNCKWATREEQQNNRRNTRNITIDEKTMSISKWSKVSGRHINTIDYRLSKGGSSKNAVFKPLQGKNQHTV